MLLTNERQYRNTKKLMAEFEESLAKLARHPEFEAQDPLFQRAHIGSLKLQISQFKDQLKEYESLKGGKFNFKKTPSVHEIPEWLIRARIATGMSEEGFARLLKVTKKEIEHYELIDYADASFGFMIRALEALQAYKNNKVRSNRTHRSNSKRKAA